MELIRDEARAVYGQRFASDLHMVVRAPFVKRWCRSFRAIFNLRCIG